MFNKSIQITHQSPREIHHHEHRAPTDEAIRLAQEMEEKVFKKITSSVRLDDNRLKAVWFRYSDPSCFVEKACCRFSLNGEDREFTIEIDRFTSPGDLATKIIGEIREKVAMAIAFEGLDARVFQIK